MGDDPGIWCAPGTGGLWILMSVRTDTGIAVSDSISKKEIMERIYLDQIYSAGSIRPASSGSEDECRRKWCAGIL